MSDLADFDDVKDAIEKLVDDWSKKIKDAAQALSDAQAEIDKLDALKKQRD